VRRDDVIGTAHLFSVPVLLPLDTWRCLSLLGGEKERHLSNNLSFSSQTAVRKVDTIPNVLNLTREPSQPWTAGDFKPPSTTICARHLQRCSLVGTACLRREQARILSFCVSVSKCDNQFTFASRRLALRATFSSLAKPIRRTVSRRRTRLYLPPALPAPLPAPATPRPTFPHPYPHARAVSCGLQRCCDVSRISRARCCYIPVCHWEHIRLRCSRFICACSLRIHPHTYEFYLLTVALIFPYLHYTVPSRGSLSATCYTDIHMAPSMATPPLLPFHAFLLCLLHHTTWEEDRQIEH